jgi:Transposase IS66 family
MDGLQCWMSEQFEQRLVEPNSGLSKALRYLLKHWDALTQFPRKAGAPLDNNVCEQALKRAILHRNNFRWLQTGLIRIHPILLTAAARVFDMMPSAIALNAPSAPGCAAVGRAIIGGVFM